MRLHDWSMSALRTRPRCLGMPFLAFIAVSVLGWAWSSESASGSPPKRQKDRPRASAAGQAGDSEVHLLPVQGRIYMLTGAGANISVQVGDDGILLVDTGLKQMSEKVLAAVRTLSDEPIRYIINTTIDADHTGGNQAIAKAGSTIAGGNVLGDIGTSAREGAAVISFQTILDRMSAPNTRDTAPQGAWPTDTYGAAQKNLFVNDEAVQIMHQPAAHTDGDSIVFFRRSDVVSTGDVFTTTGYPVIDLERGGTIQGVVEALNVLLYRITVSGPKQEGGTLIIPGHGRLCDQADLVVYQEMVTIIRDRIQDMVQKGMTLEQVKAARPTNDYDPVYGQTAGPWTTDMFVEAAYKSLVSRKGSAQSESASSLISRKHE
jgi:cyclase